MLSQHHRSLGVGCDSGTAPDPHQLLAFPPHPQLLLASFRPTLPHQLGVLSAPASRFLKLHTTRTSREYAVSRTQQHLPRQAAKKVGCRSMMSSTTSSTTPEPSQLRRFHFQASETNDAVFAFRMLPQPAMALSFPPRLSPPRPRKRCRAVADIDGEHSCLYKKKRRLRLFLITSRLSPQFSHPATNIVDRGSSKIAVWAKQKALGRNLLRKAAILNRIRRRTIAVKETEGGLGSSFVEREREQKQLELAKLAFVYGSHDTHTRPVLQRVPSFPPACAVRAGDHFEISGALPSEAPSPSPSSPSFSEDTEDNTLEYRSPNDAYSYSPPRAQIPRRSYLPLPPSPLGLSNYDAFDLEDEIPDPYAHLDDDYEEPSADLDDGMQDVDPRSPSANTSVSYTSTRSTAGTGNSEALKTPPQMLYSDFSILDPEEPVFGDYDQVDGGADAIWPNALAGDASSQPLLPASSSPNLSALFATSKEDAVPLSPNFSATSMGEPIQGQWTGSQRPEVLARKENDLEQERERQRNLMFLRFNS